MFHRCKVFCLKRRKAMAFLSVTVLSLCLFQVLGVPGKEPNLVPSDDLQTGNYRPDWESLDSRPLPSWYDEAKIGIFMHFGPYAVSGYVSEWFWYLSERLETEYDRKCAKYLRDYYPPKFTYQDFGPMLTMEFFDSDIITDIVAESGAKYFVFTSKHHDGYCNWPSSYSYGWNSMAVGPKRNILKELRTSFAQRHADIRFGLYYSLYEWFNPLYLKDKATNFTTRKYVENKMMPELKELVTKFSPQVLWVDGDWEAPPEYWGSQDILSWLYNESPSKDSVVTNDRWGVGTGMTHGDYFSGPDRYEPGQALPHKWENAMTIDLNSWGIRRDLDLEDVMPPEILIEKVVSTISCGGNILVNVGPTKEGTILPIFRERLRQMGAWLRANGEAIYGTTPWIYQNDTLDGDTWYTQKGSLVYAIVVGWPEDDVIKLSAPRVEEGLTTISFLGMGPSEPNLPYKVEEDEEGGGRVLSVQFPSMSRLLSACGEGCQWAYVLRFANLQNSQV